MGNIERGGGVAVESDGESAAGAGLVPLVAAFLPRAMFDCYREERKEKKGGAEREERKRGTGERRRVTAELCNQNR